MTEPVPPGPLPGPPAAPVGPSAPRRNTAGAWAAAALVLALGSLMFVVIAHIRITDLEGRVATLEGDARTGVTAPAATVATPSTSARPAPEQQTAPTSPEQTVPPEPADVEAARADVVAAFRAVYDGGATEERVRHVDDPTGVAAAIETVRNGPNSAAVTAAKVNVQQIRFVSESRAQVIYGVDVNGQNAIAARQGEARVVDGEWKVTRATVCQDLQSVGTAC